MILVDTSAWIEYQRATGSLADLRLTRAIETDEPLATTGLVLLELLAGARDEQHARDLRRLLDRCSFLRSRSHPTTKQRPRSTGAAVAKEARSAGSPTA